MSKFDSLSERAEPHITSLRFLILIMVSYDFSFPILDYYKEMLISNQIKIISASVLQFQRERNDTRPWDENT